MCVMYKTFGNVLSKCPSIIYERKEEVPTRYISHDHDTGYTNPVLLAAGRKFKNERV